MITLFACSEADQGSRQFVLARSIVFNFNDSDSDAPVRVFSSEVQSPPVVCFLGTDIVSIYFYSS
jgi:hypothetical protein